MIVFDLSCEGGHRFEGWFGSSQDFDRQQDSGLVSCPSCGSQSISKAPMAPALVSRSGSDQAERAPAQRRGGEGADAAPPAPLPPAVQHAFAKLAQAQAEALRHSRWVGAAFAEASRAMHYGEREEEAIHGRATPEEARALLDEGVPVAPLLVPIAPPDEVN